MALSAPPLSRSTIAQLPHSPVFSPPFPNCLHWKASGQGHRENSGVTVAPHITIVMLKQCLTAKPNTKFDSQLTLTQLPTPFPLLSLIKKSSSLSTPCHPDIPSSHNPINRDTPLDRLLCKQTLRHHADNRKLPDQTKLRGREINNTFKKSI